MYMDTSDAALATVIDQIWHLFDSCCDMHDARGIPDPYNDAGSSAFDDYWKQRQAFNALLLQHYISHTAGLNKRVKRMADDWTMRMVSEMLFDSEIDGDTGRSALIHRLSEFRDKVESVIALRINPLDIELSDVINEIWGCFRDCSRIKGVVKVVYGVCDISSDDSWKQTLLYNGFILQQSFHTSNVINTNILRKGDEWVKKIIPNIVDDLRIETDTKKQSLIRTLLEFRVQLNLILLAKSNPLDDQTSKIINEIWKCFRDYDAHLGIYNLVYATCDISGDSRWKEIMNANVSIMQRVSRVMDTNVRTQAIQWLYVLVPMLVDDSLSGTTAKKEQKLQKLREFKTALELDIHTQFDPASQSANQTQPILKNQSSYSELHIAIDRLSNLYDQIYPTT